MISCSLVLSGFIFSKYLCLLFIFHGLRTKDGSFARRASSAVVLPMHVKIYLADVYPSPGLFSLIQMFFALSPSFTHLSRLSVSPPVCRGCVPRFLNVWIACVNGSPGLDLVQLVFGRRECRKVSWRASPGKCLRLFDNQSFSPNAIYHQTQRTIPRPRSFRITQIVAHWSL